MKTIRYRQRGRILGGILMLCSILFLFLPFIGLSFVSLSLSSGGVSPLMLFIYSFPAMAVGGMTTVLLILHDLLFLGTLTMCILTGVFILVNKKYFPAFIASIVYGVLALFYIIVCIVINSSMTAISGLSSSYGLNLSSYGLSTGDLSITFLPTLWLILGVGLAIAPAFFVRKEVILPPPPPPPVNPDDFGERTIPGSKSNMQGIEVQVRYSDNSGTHTVKREIYTDRGLTIGRSESCKICLVDRRVSSKHAVLYYDDLNGMVIEDCGSSNGIQVNGDTIMGKARITEDDSIRIGDCKLAFRVLGKLDDLDGEVTIPANERYHEALRVRLQFVDDGGPRKENVVLRETANIGRDRDCEVSIDSNTVSRRHARLINLGHGRVAIEDNASANYVFVNGTKIESETELRTGDVIRLGKVDVTIEF